MNMMRKNGEWTAQDDQDLDMTKPTDEDQEDDKSWQECEPEKEEVKEEPEYQKMMADKGFMQWMQTQMDAPSKICEEIDDDFEFKP